MLKAIRLETDNERSGLGGRFGAVIVKSGKVVATGVNQVTASNDPTAHTKVLAKRSACTTLWTFHLDGHKVYTSCEPCPMCLSAIYWVRCKAIFYGNVAVDVATIGFDDSFLYDEMRIPLYARKIPTMCLLPDEAWESFAAWSDNPLKVSY